MSTNTLRSSKPATDGSVRNSTKRAANTVQWILQEFEDTVRLANALDRLGLPYSFHRVVPFVGELDPAPIVTDPHSVVLFGSYTLWRAAAAHDYRPGVFTVRPFVNEKAWRPFLLNGPEARFLTLREAPERLADEARNWFVRPVEDTKEIAGRVRSSAEIVQMAEKVLALDETDIPNGSLRHDTRLMLSKPVEILQEWRVWIVEGRIVTFSLYKEGVRVVYRPEIDDDALLFCRTLADANPDYSPAYVMDVCRTENGLRLLETNCVNAAGSYAADLQKLAASIDALSGG